MKDKFIGYQCSLCGTQYSPQEITYTCLKDGGNLDVILDIDSIKSQPFHQWVAAQEPSLWRYLSILPINEIGGEGTPFRAVGWTPTYQAARLAKQLGLNALWIKDESRNPSASFKDRASSVVLARAAEINAEVVVTASTGNAGAALACMAAALGQKAVIFAPRTAPPAKIAQLLVFGAEVLLVDGNYDQAFDLSIQTSQAFGWYCRNTGYNPFTAEGKKTASLEIVEWWLAQLKNPIIGEMKIDVRKPLSIFVSVGDGNIISGLHKGLKDLASIGILPLEGVDTSAALLGMRIFGVQSEGSAAISNAYFANTEKITPVAANTLADSISVDLPRDGVRALRAARQTGGAYVTVSDAQILEAIAEIGKLGIFAEPAGASALAGLSKALKTGLISTEDQVLLLNTGSGLKDVKAAMLAIQQAPIIEPTLEAVIKSLKL